MIEIEHRTNIPEAVVISGGGAKFFYELGVLEALLRRQKVNPFAFLGVSAGALLASYMAQSKFDESRVDLIKTLRDLKKISREIQSPEDIFTRRVPELPAMLDEFLALAISPSIYSLNPLKMLIEREISTERLKNSDRSLRVGAVSLESGEYVSISERNDNILKFILASSSIPIMFPPVEIEGAHYVDGGVVNVTPLSELFDLCKERDINEVRVHVILSSPFGAQRMERFRWRSVDIATRTAELLVDEIFRNDIRVAQLRNLEEDAVKARFVIYQPGPEGPGIDSLAFTKEDTRVAYLRGWHTKGVPVT